MEKGNTDEIISIFTRRLFCGFFVRKIPTVLRDMSRLGQNINQIFFARYNKCV